MKFKRTYTVSIAGGTATATITIPQSGRIVGIGYSAIAAAAGSWELSRSSTSQIATAVPDSGVIDRVRFAAPLSSVGVIPPTVIVKEIEIPVKVLDLFYLHCTGTGNVGELMLYLA
jgi:hypothetical protein